MVDNKQTTKQGDEDNKNLLNKNYDLNINDKKDKENELKKGFIVRTPTNTYELKECSGKGAFLRR